jgi:cobalt-zinc-cadmium efflux system outer membrane protein
VPIQTLAARIVAGLILCPAVGLAAGCVGAVPRVDAGGAAATAAGLSEPIRFTYEGGSLDIDSNDPSRLSLAEAARQALLASPEVQAALAEVRAALAEAMQARTLPNPVLDVAVRFPTGDGSEVIEAGLSQSLAELLRRPGRSRAADARLRAAAARAVGEALDVLAAVERTYAEAWAAGDRLAVLDRQAALLDRLLELAQARQRAGEAGRLDVIGFQARRAALAAEAESVRAKGRSARLRLARLVGRPSGAAEWELDRWTPPPAVPAGEGEWLALSLERRPEVQAAVFELTALGAEVRLASLNPFDDLGAGVEVESEEELSVGPAASLPIPLFDLGRHRRARAEAERAAARHRLTQVRRQVVEEVRQALAAAESARRAAALVEEQLLPLQRDRVEQVEAAYRAGFADVTEVLLAEQDLLDAEAQLIEARQGVADAAADLRRAAGGVATPEANDGRIPASATTRPTTQTTTRNDR